MSNFAPDSPLDAESFHQMQMEHYRNKQSADYQRRKEERRRPPPLANVLAGPQGQMRESSFFAPTSQRQPHPRRVINRSKSGRFVPEDFPTSSSRPPSARPEYGYPRPGSGMSAAPPSSRPDSAQRFRTPEPRPGSGLSAAPSPRAPPSYRGESPRASMESQHPSPSRRPGSASSNIFGRTFSFGSGSRTNTMDSKSKRNSGESTTSKKPAPRRSSFKDTLRRASHELQKDLHIVFMSEEKRQKYYAEQRARMEAEIEEQHRQNPLSRPIYQQEYIRNRDIQQNGGGWQKYDDVLLHYGPDHQIAQLDENDRFLARELAKDEEKEEAMNAPPMNAGERAAFLVSKATDVFKPKPKEKDRQGSTESGMDFADAAPVDADELECCQRCGKPTWGTEWLVKGFCRDCHAVRVQQEFWDADSTPTPDTDARFRFGETVEDAPETDAEEEHEHENDSSYGSARSSLSSQTSAASKPREVDEEQYMKTARDRRVRRLRQTIYEDPGNPFALDLDESTPLAASGVDPFASPKPQFPPRSSSKQQVARTLSTKRNLSLSSWDTFALSSQPPSPHLEEPPHVISHLRDSLLHTPKPRRAGTPTLIRQHKYSDSAPSRAAEGGEGETGYVPPRTRWKSLPSNGRAENAEERNTRFYGFWEGVWREYSPDVDDR